MYSPLNAAPVTGAPGAVAVAVARPYIKVRYVKVSCRAVPHGGMLRRLPSRVPAGAVRVGATPAGQVQPAPAPAMAGAGMVLTRTYHAMMTATGKPHAAARFRAWGRVA
ncbi:hypothetical protein [Komagataeibacter europaeus]|nr:hypothetical protein [Komagataeibacter europaeus]